MALIQGIPNGSTIMCGGFGLCGIPRKLINMISGSMVSELTVISNNPRKQWLGFSIIIKKK